MSERELLCSEHSIRRAETWRDAAPSPGWLYGLCRARAAPGKELGCRSGRKSPCEASG